MSDISNLTTFTIEGLKDQMTAAQKPAIPEGWHPAVVMNVAPQVSDKTGSVGFSWLLAVEPQAEEEISPFGNAVLISEYTFLGRLKDGSLTFDNGQINFSTLNALRACGVADNTIDFAAQIGKIVDVQIKHEPAYNDPSRLVAKVKGWRVYSGSENGSILKIQDEGVFERLQDKAQKMLEARANRNDFSAPIDSDVL